VTRLAVIIVAFNARDDLRAALASLISTPPKTPHELIVVDNASSDGLPDMLRRGFPTVRLIEAGDNLGFARANNLGIRQSASELVLLLNPDTVVPAGVIDQLIAVLDASLDVAVVGPRIVDAQGRAEMSWGDRVSPWMELRRKLTTPADAGDAARANQAIEGATRTARDVAWVSGACLLARRTDLEAAGLLDERYFLYMEDVDLCETIAARGRRIRFEPSVEIVHLRGRSKPAGGGRAERAWHASHLAYYRKHLPLWAPILWAYQKLRG
jgi:GT2 family glycosyltransferase